jgi:hypothetical protein
MPLCSFYQQITLRAFAHYPNKIQAHVIYMKNGSSKLIYRPIVYTTQGSEDWLPLNLQTPVNHMFQFS